MNLSANFSASEPVAMAACKEEELYLPRRSWTSCQTLTILEVQASFSTRVDCEGGRNGMAGRGRIWAQCAARMNER